MIISKNFLWSRYKYFHFLKNLNLTRSENAIVRGRPCFRQPSMCGLPLSAAVAARGTVSADSAAVSASAALAWNRQSRRNRQSRQNRQRVLTMSLDDWWSRAWRKGLLVQTGGSGSHANRGKNRQRGFVQLQVRRGKSAARIFRTI
jgi:hypothetical protein